LGLTRPANQARVFSSDRAPEAELYLIDAAPLWPSSFATDNSPTSVINQIQTPFLWGATQGLAFPCDSCSIALKQNFVGCLVWTPTRPHFFFFFFFFVF
jgi:hypothetical protein